VSVTPASTSVASRSRIQLVGEWVAASAVIVACLRLFLTNAFLARPAITDRGTFIAYGKLVAEGAVLYRDVWDNKPPVIHLLGALAWSIAPRVEAAYQMERLVLLLSAAALFAMLRYALGFRILPALCGLVAGLTVLRNPEAFSGGYSTEEFGMLFEIAAIACVGLAFRSHDDGAARAGLFGFGLLTALAILTRQTFLAALGAIWLAAHVPLLRSPRRLVSAIGWEVAGFALPIVGGLVYLWSTGSFSPFLELLPETFAFSSTPFVWNMTPGSRLGVGVQYWSPAAMRAEIGGRTLRALEWFVAIVFHGERRTAMALATIGMIAALAATTVRRRGKTMMSIAPLVLPFWFAAELAVASAPGNYYGPYYLPFVPLVACVVSLVAEVLVPIGSGGAAHREGWRVRSRVLAVTRVSALLACLTVTLWSLDAWYRIDPTKYWWLFAPNVHMPAQIVERVRQEADGSGSRRYVPLFTNSPEVLLDMPLKPGTRFLAQYPFQFQGPESPRGRELLQDLSAADVLVEDAQRLKLDRDLEARIQSIVQTSFVADFDWSHFHFYHRRKSTAP
jgi:hypothetical protein